MVINNDHHHGGGDDHFPINLQNKTGREKARTYLLIRSYFSSQ
jgi:hypothetical protein